ncbi:MAG: AarF/UbiB family protein [Gammaproteobacteria bacterium]|nr:AarF/UbiB family protein [Gammaproteobacteria bacterium]MDE0246395.1 AarF/UbiB family protein [Gammaproteobacteria bacterium]
MKRTLRGLRIFATLAPFLVGFLRDRRRFLIIGRPASRRPGHHAGRAERLVAAVADLGPTFIKLAQVLSARADLIREPYFSAIGTLQDQVPPISGDGALAVVEAALGRPAGEVFDSFEPRPIAAASLGQVHRAALRGREVAVKVLRPDVESVVAIDLDLSFRLLFWLNILFPNHQVRGITNVVREFSVRVREEMDFRSEAANIERFHRLMADVEGVRAPEVIGELTRKEVLVMEHLEGTKVDRLDERFASGELEFEPVMRRLTGLYLRMMMLDGFLHADPHPGNLLVGPDGTIIVLDWGMVLDVPKQTRDTILSVALSVGREDLDGVISGMYGLGMISPEVSRGEIREAAIEIMKVIERVRTSPVDRVREVVQEIWDTFQTWPLLLPQELVYFFRTAVLLEAIGFRYDPEFNGLHLIRRVVTEHRGELLRKTGREPVALALDFMGEVGHVLRSVRDLLQRAEREELRVRLHPRDQQAQERFMHLQARRFLLSVFATAIAVISAVVYVAIGSPLLLALGLAVALVMFVLVLFIPTHLLENPLRHARGIRPP